MSQRLKNEAHFVLIARFTQIISSKYIIALFFFVQVKQSGFPKLSKDWHSQDLYQNTRNHKLK